MVFVIFHAYHNHNGYGLSRQLLLVVILLPVASSYYDAAYYSLLLLHSPLGCLILLCNLAGYSCLILLFLLC
ncbi:hypothetical protein V6Z12_D09G135400 [Gossypium hirsutum]